MSPIRSSSAAILPRPVTSSAPRARGVGDQVLVRDRVEDRQPCRARHRVAAVRGAVRTAPPALLERRGSRRSPRVAGRWRSPWPRTRRRGRSPRARRPTSRRSGRSPTGPRRRSAGSRARRRSRAARAGTRRVPGCSHLRRGRARSGSRRPSTARRPTPRSDCRLARRGRGRGLLVASELGMGRRVGREVDARQQRLVARPVVEVRGRHAGRPERPAVEATAERDDPGPAGHAPCELERPVDRLRARVQEHHRIERVGEGRGQRRPPAPRSAP